jgi:hypothetical protein
MTFRNAIVGGENLVIPAIQSPNYSAGVQGWRISRDGFIEMNTGTFRGSIESGPIPGQHFIVNNPATGHVVDIYDSGNNLICSIDGNGFINTYGVGIPDVPTIQIGLGGIAFFDSLTTQAGEVTIGEGAGSTELRVSSPVLAAGGTSLNLELVAPSASASYALLDQRGITGAVVQTDHAGDGNQLIHLGAYVVTTDAAGAGTFNHLAGFTPKFGFLAGANGLGAANFPYQYAWFPGAFTANTAKAQFEDNLGHALVSTTVGVFGAFFG